MQRRFNGRDILYFGGIGVILLVVVLAMYMIDRQWQKLARMEQLMREQANDLREIGMRVRDLDGRVAKGATLSAAGKPEESQSGGVPPAFQRAYATTQQADYASGDWLVQAFNVNLKTITPLVSNDVYATKIQSYVLESLLIRNPETLEWEGLLAKSWSVSEDGMTFIFKLRDGLTFSDGVPLTADDVAFSYRFMMTEAIQAPTERSYYSKIKSVEALDPHTVKFRFREPYFNALTLAGGMDVMPKHFYEPYLKRPNEFNQSKGLLLGSGPYRLEDPRGWSPDKGMVELRRNPRYWGPVEPAFDRILWRSIENDSARLTTFRNGDIDSYGSRPIEYQKLVEDTELAKKASHWEYRNPLAGYSYLGWNQARKGKPTRFADRRVREAMTYLIDRQRIIQEIYLGYGEVAMSPFRANSRQHDPALSPRAYDPGKGEELLRQAGYEDRNGDGMLEDADGNPFEFELVYGQSSEDTGRLVLFLKDMLARAGILLKPKPSEWAVMVDLLDRRDFDAMALGWSGTLESDLYQIFHSSQIEGSGNNAVNYRNPKLDRLIEEARATVDEKKRMPLWQAAENEIYRDQPYTFLMRRKSLVFIDRRIKNVVKTKIGLNLGDPPIENYVPLKEQRYQQ